MSEVLEGVDVVGMTLQHVGICWQQRLHPDFDAVPCDGSW